MVLPRWLMTLGFSEGVDFQTAYLAGYLADKYDVDAAQSMERANERIKKSAEQNFRQTVQGYASVIPEAMSVQLQNGKAKYALYPVWLLNTTWEGKQYTFAMNGQTGKMVGVWRRIKALTGNGCLACGRPQVRLCLASAICCGCYREV